MHKNDFTLPVSFIGSYAKDEPNFPWQNNVILQKRVPGINKVVNFKGFSRANKEIKYFFKDQNRIQGLFTIVQTMP